MWNIIMDRMENKQFATSVLAWLLGNEQIIDTDQPTVVALNIRVASMFNLFIRFSEKQRDMFVTFSAVAFGVY